MKNLFAWMLIVALAPASAEPALDAAPVAIEPVRIDAELAPPTWLQKRLRRVKMRTDPGAAPTRLAASVYRPSGAGPYPAVVLLHDCRGPQDYQDAWARQLAAWGYLALRLDSHAARGADDTCNRPRPSRNHEIALLQSYDAFAAQRYLTQRPDIDRLRIAVMGWSRHAVLSAILRDGVQQFYPRPFKAAIAFGADCGIATSARFSSPLLVLNGGRDDWSPAHLCARVAERGRRAGAAVELQVYADAAHGFDDPDTRGGRWLRHASNPYRQPALGAHLEFDAQAAADARRLVRGFLEREVRYSPFRGSLDDMPPAFERKYLKAASWAIDPIETGPDIPPLGRSAFDRLFSRTDDGRGVYAIPYPFARIVERLAAQVAPAERYREAVSVVLIPRGRSLQREVAAPDYFHYPRIVAGITREPLEDHRGRRPLLKDRLYIAHVESTDVLEVISFNREADRFEYQLVRNYRADAEPEVFYARRRLCLACHQNHAPIFPNAPWAETNASREIMARLRATREEFQGLPGLALGNSANNLDRAANRANHFALHSLLWRQLCDAPLATNEARCRAALMRSVLQFALSNANGFDRNDEVYGHDFVAPAAANWLRLWPDGLKIPFANLPDRDPLALLGDIPPGLDPLTRRDPEFIWHWGDKVMDRVTAAMAERLLSTDLLRLDRGLIEHADRERMPAVRRQYLCDREIDRSRGNAFPLGLSCRDAQRRLVLRARLDSSGETGEIDWYEAGPGLRLAALDLRRRPGDGPGAEYSLHNRGSSLSVRLPNGNRLERLRLMDAGASASSLVMFELADFAAVDAALRATVDLRGDRNPLLESARFDPLPLMRRLAAELGVAYPPDCCVDDAPLPAPQTEPTLAVASGSNPLVAKLDRYCAACHATDASVPPPFLRGDQARVLAQLRECGPRINYRLGMWNTLDTERGRSPMPPIQPAQHSASGWSDSMELAQLRRLATDLLPTGQGAVDVAQLLTGKYEDLPACRPGLPLAREDRSMR